MSLRSLMVSSYILSCCCLRTKPCKYFQLNARYFNTKKGIFSKYDTDSLILEKWRLPQQWLSDNEFCLSFPVFIKPEWGQNSSGVVKADNQQTLQALKRSLIKHNVEYVVQQGSDKKNEYEIFFIANQNEHRYQVLTVTQVCNDKEAYPVNSIYNANTRYIDITAQLDEGQKQSLWDIVRQLGCFGIARVGVRADSISELLNECLDVIEINMFVPMPINIIDKRYNAIFRARTLISYMWQLAKVTKSRDTSLIEKPVFIKQMLYNRSNAFLKYIQQRI